MLNLVNTSLTIAQTAKQASPFQSLSYNISSWQTLNNLSKDSTRLRLIKLDDREISTSPRNFHHLVHISCKIKRFLNIFEDKLGIK